MIRSVLPPVVLLDIFKRGGFHMLNAPFLNYVRRRATARIALAGLLAGLIASAALLPDAAGAATSHKVHHVKLVVFAASQPGFGTILTTQAGYTLYTNVADTQDNSVVASQPYAPAWPALVLPHGDVLFAGRGIVGLGTVTLPNGLVQITWQGLPLYTFIKDTTPHAVNGDGVKGFVPAFVALQKKK
jgi:predicted lipoprotein with Yx(FWY)xxD motif